MSIDHGTAGPPARALSALLEASPVPGRRLHRGRRDPVVTGITADSRAVEPGNVFVAVRGTRLDGHAFIEEAVERGAAAVVAERGTRDVGVPVLLVPNARRALAALAAAWYGFPAHRIPIVGITGTFGKTSVLSALEAVMRSAGRPIGVIGSEIIGVRVADRFRHETPLTTPDAVSLQRALARIVAAGAPAAAMEVTSQALVQERVHGISFAAGVFTNLRPLEHRESHGTFRAYAAAKRRFFEHLAAGAPVVYTAGERAVRKMVRAHDVAPISCGMGGPVAVRVEHRMPDLASTAVRMTVRRPLPALGGGCVAPLGLEFQLPLLGRTHALNACLGATVALLLGAPPESVADGLSALPPVRRRAELVHAGRFTVIDDAATHPESLGALFELVCRIPHRRLHIVAAIRGRRGVELNRRYGEAIAIWSERVPIRTLIATASEEAVEEADWVEPAERTAFLAPLERAGVRLRFLGRLDEAIATALELVGGDDLLVLTGAQGMHRGAEILERELRRAGVRAGGPSARHDPEEEVDAERVRLR